MKKLIRIARHEFKMTAANKAFVIMTILGPFLIILVAVLPTMIGAGGAMAGPAPDTPVGLYCPDPAFSAALMPALEAVKCKPSAFGDDKELKEAVAKGRLKYGISLPAGSLEGAPSGGPDKPRIYSLSSADMTAFAMFEGMVGEIAVSSRLAAYVSDPLKVREILQRPAFEVIKVDEGGKETAADRNDFMSTLFTLIGFVMLIYMTTLLYGQLIGRSVVVEKTSKTVEIMLSSVSPMDLMFGKVIGMGLAGLLQYLIWISASLVLILVAGPVLGLAIPASITPPVLGWLFLFFLLGYFMYSAAYAALGAAAEDETHLGQLAWPLLIFLMLPMLFVPSMIGEMDGPFIQFMSFFPLTAPIVMFARTIAGHPQAWEILVSVALQLLTIWGMVKASAKIFRVGILMTGKRFSFAEVIKWVGRK